MTNFSNILVNIAVRVASKRVKRCRFIIASYSHRNLGFLIALDLHQSVISGVGSWTLHLALTEF